eukprot:Awhi_evm1s12326
MSIINNSFIFLSLVTCIIIVTVDLSFASPVRRSTPKFPVGTSFQNRAWCPDYGSGCNDASVDGRDAVIVDLFYTSESEIRSLGNNRIVICYLSAGTVEPNRPDADDFPDHCLGKGMSGWNEKWLDVRCQDDFKHVIRARVDLAVSKGCHAIEFDNVDCWENDCVSGKSKFDSELEQEQLRYNKYLGEMAKSKGLAAGLKNDVHHLAQLEPYFEFAINEQCQEANKEWCQKYTSPFINKNKAVLATEYKGSSACSIGNDLNFYQ